MKPFETNDGHKFTNAIAWRQHKASLDNKGAGATAEAEEDGKSVAQEHGPAHEIHIEHDHQSGTHRVRSMHQDGYEHQSEHGSAEEAHDHAKDLGTGHSEEAIDGLKKFAEEEGEE
jgi:hypothetical protein